MLLVGSQVRPADLTSFCSMHLTFNIVLICHWCVTGMVLTVADSSTSHQVDDGLGAVGNFHADIYGPKVCCNAALSIPQAKVCGSWCPDLGVHVMHTSPAFTDVFLA